MTNPNDWNTRVIEEFRANGGNVEQFKGVPLLLLHHTGAKSGRSYINPLAYLADGERMVVFGSKAGSDTNPDWYHNLVAHPDVKVELAGGKLVDAKAVVLQGAERERIYDRQVERVPVFAEYRAKTSRQIPVIALEPA
ncbi:MAG TPA: nitroreductase/quinone reductase family protein [Dehalococcoidia bacterium]|nr:nitroreductase/quinone reductase family protein [Dehalococcoidia bacterium]